MAVSGALNWLKENFSIQAFSESLAIGVFAFFVLAFWVWMNTDAVLEKQQERLASQTAIIEWVSGSAPVMAGHDDGTSSQHDAIALSLTPHEDSDDKKAPEHHETPPANTASGPASIAELPKLESGLAIAPVEGLYEDAPGGRLPVINHKAELSPFAAYRRPFDIYSLGSNKSVIALGIMDIGLSDSASGAAISSLPPEVSMILSPYATSIDFWNNEARARGHETWLLLPVEPHDYPAQDPGPNTLLIGSTERQNKAKLDWLLSRTTGYVGFITNRNPAFMESQNDVRPIVGDIYRRGLAFIDSSAVPGPIPQSMAIGMKAPYGSVDAWIDIPATDEHIAEAFSMLEKTAKERGFAIGILRPLPVSYQALQQWIKTLDSKDLALAPLSGLTGR